MRLDEIETKIILSVNKREDAGQDDITETELFEELSVDPDRFGLAVDRLCEGRMIHMVVRQPDGMRIVRPFMKLTDRAREIHAQRAEAARPRDRVKAWMDVARRNRFAAPFVFAGDFLGPLIGVIGGFIGIVGGFLGIIALARGC